MIALLSLRALLGIGNDLLGADILQANGLSEALLDIHQEELGQPSGFSTLLNVKATSDLAEEKKMQITAKNPFANVCKNAVPNRKVCAYCWAF